ncbi:hypothetical protein [Clostridium sporogenes]|uniref:hypothetical protein n=1 Tax=Clostridium sporogenes TaxID=1509 RepID=UPI001FABE3DD|nr:hypothetical protein [Clostridium sporogenes]
MLTKLLICYTQKKSKKKRCVFVMKLKLVEFTESYAKEICDWNYDAEYPIYNYTAWNKIFNEKWAITIKEKRKREFFLL